MARHLMVKQPPMASKWPNILLGDNCRWPRNGPPFNSDGTAGGVDNGPPISSNTTADDLEMAQHLSFMELPVVSKWPSIEVSM